MSNFNWYTPKAISFNNKVGTEEKWLLLCVKKINKNKTNLETVKEYWETATRLNILLWCISWNEMSL